MDLPPASDSAPSRRDALLVFANALALDLHQRRLPRAAGPLLAVGPLADAAFRAGADVHWFEHGPVRLAGSAHHAQTGRNFAERLCNAVEALRAAGYERVVIVGRDCPSLTAEDVTLAFARLREGDASVLGPATDGGCYLIGLQCGHADRLRNVSWHRGTDFRRLQARFAGLPGSELASKSDLDSWLDLRRLAESVEWAAALARRILALLVSNVARACNAGAGYSCEDLAAARERGQLPPPVAA